MVYIWETIYRRCGKKINLFSLNKNLPNNPWYLLVSPANFNKDLFAKPQDGGGGNQKLANLISTIHAAPLCQSF